VRKKAQTTDTGVSAYFDKSEHVEILRSEIRPASYNPRKITPDARKKLKASIKRHGVVGGMVVNARTGNTLVSGHQKLSILDELNHYPDNDYRLRVERIDVDEKAEKELNLFFNNPSAMGEFDYDALRELIPEIDFEVAGFTPEDLDVIGVDFTIQTQDEANLAAALSEATDPLREERERQKQLAHAAKQLAAEEGEDEEDDETDESYLPKTDEERAAHVKTVKAQIKEQATQKGMNMSAYVTLSFDNFQEKASFMEYYGYDPSEMFIKGEVFGSKITRIDD
jgi:hypothetical protein